MIEVGARPLTLADVVMVARDGMGVRLARGVRERMEASRAVVDAAVRENRVIYGVTTGFGELKDKHIPPSDVRQLQINLLRSHAAGVGPDAPGEVARAMILLRAASLAHGYSGVRPELVDALLLLLERHVTPAVPIQGSVGASGDLAPLAHLAQVLVGEGEAWLGPLGEGNARRMPASLALRGAGLQPLTLEAKEGLALINGTQFSTAIAALACADASADASDFGGQGGRCCRPKCCWDRSSLRARTCSRCGRIAVRSRPRAACAPLPTAARWSPRIATAAGCRIRTACAACRR